MRRLKWGSSVKVLTSSLGSGQESQALFQQEGVAGTWRAGWLEGQVHPGTWGLPVLLQSLKTNGGADRVPRSLRDSSGVFWVRKV